jgi:hypothetical protein
VPPRKMMLSLPRPTVRIIIIKTPAIRSPGEVQLSMAAPITPGADRGSDASLGLHPLPQSPGYLS